MRRIAAAALVLCADAGAAAKDAAKDAPRDLAQHAETVVIRGKEQTLHVYGGPPAPGRPTALVASGDLGWNGFSVDVAETLAAAGFRVAGFNVRAYLASFTGKDSRLGPGDVPGDFRPLLDRLAPDAHERVLLLGVSEGAGLAVLAASHPSLRDRVRGVVAFGLPDENELGWKWSDMMMYLTKRPPKEPSFRVATVIAALAPVPLASIFSTHDEYTPLAEEEALLALAGEPKRLWMVAAGNHRFSDNRAGALAAMREAIAWIDAASRTPASAAPSPYPGGAAGPAPGDLRAPGGERPAH